MKTQVIGIQGFNLVGLFALVLLFGTACTKNDDIDCLGCTEIVIDDTLILETGKPEPDSTNIVIDDTLIL